MGGFILGIIVGWLIWGKHNTSKIYYVIYIPSKTQWLKGFENDKPIYTCVVREAALYLESELDYIKEDMRHQRLDYEIQEYKEA